VPDRFPCRCCGYLTLKEQPPGTFDICPVCFWEDESVDTGGANAATLVEARENFRRFGACTENERDCVRPPTPDEIPPSE
jgi:hypothetical protein